MSEKFLIRGAGEEWGRLTIQEAYRTLSSGDVNPPIEYWHEETKKWRPISRIMFDLEPTRLEEMKNAGIRFVRVLGSDDDCPSCSTFANNRFPIEELPEIPSPQCTCIPWCRLCLVAEP